MNNNLILRKRRTKGETFKALSLSALFLFSFLFFINLTSAWNFPTTTTSSTTVINISTNGTTVLHNDLSDLQGGIAGQYYHIRQTWYNLLNTNINNWITNSVDNLVYYVPYIGANQNVNLSNYNLSTNNLNVTGLTNSTFMGDVRIFGTIFGGSPLKVDGGLNVSGLIYGNGSALTDINSSTIVSSVGNWSADKSLYLLISQWNATNISYMTGDNFTIQNNSLINWITSTFVKISDIVNKVGNWSADKASYTSLNVLNNGSYLNYPWNTTNTSYVLRTGDNMTGDLNLNGNQLRNISQVNPLGSNLTIGGNVSFQGGQINLQAGIIRNVTWINPFGTGVNLGGNVYIDGNLSVKRPYAIFTDNTSQPATLANTPYVMNFSIIEDQYLIQMTNRQNITVAVANTSDFLFEVSPLLYCTGQTPTIVDMWWQKNGVNVVRSNTRIYIPNNNQEVSMTIPFIIDLKSGDNLRIMWQASKTTCSIIDVAAGTNQPETPSTILTITKISEDVEHTL